MHLVEIRLNSFLYHFRRLTWTEEAAIQVAKGEDPREVILTHALHDISGLPVGSLADAKQVIKAIPKTLRWRIWVVYRGNQSEDRYFSTRGLFEAPDHQAYNKRLIDEGDAAEEVDPVNADIERRFGAEDAAEARLLQRAMLEQASKALAARKPEEKAHRG